MASNIKAITPESDAADSEVPPKVLVHDPATSPIFPGCNEDKEAVVILPRPSLLGVDTRIAAHGSLYQACDPPLPNTTVNVSNDRGV